LKLIVDFLCCPICLGELDLVDVVRIGDDIIGGRLICRNCSHVYPIRDGIPSFLISNCFGFSNRFQRLFYNVYAPFYDLFERRLASLVGFREEDLRSRVVECMDIGRFDSVLEICIGTGGNIPFFRRYTDGLIVGLDISSSMLNVCRDKIERFNWSGVELVLGCAEYLPFKSNVFDRLLIGGGISYFSDVGRALREAVRVVKPGCKLVVYEQISFLDRFFGKDKLPLKLLPDNVEFINYEYLFGKRFYVLELKKKY